MATPGRRARPIGALGRLAFALGATLALAACIPTVHAPRPRANVPAVQAPNALALGAARVAALARLDLAREDSAAALASFVESCPRLLAREDTSALTRPEDWRAPCEAARDWPKSDARGFFIAQFDAVRVGDGGAFVTGYFEPEIAGCRAPRKGCETPVYRLPDDLVRAWSEDIPEDRRTGRAPLMRRAADGSLVPYYERAEIEDGALAGRGLELAYVEDPVEFFFLQIQGSGRIRTESGDIIRIGYAGQNGREYVSIGKVMRERGLIGDGPGQYPPSMQGIVQYLRDHPEDGRALMRLNKSWVFFRELSGDGPLGALGVPVRARRSLAVDPRFVPLGAPVWLDSDRDEADGLWIAQDTGGAIKGANRFDTFWGAGEEARRIAGSMSARGKAYVLLPKPAAARLAAR